MRMPAGNVSIGKFIVPYPHVRQVLVPEGGCRVILGTDGLWDFLAAAKIFSSTGRMAPAAAAQALCKQAFAAQVCILRAPFKSQATYVMTRMQCWPGHQHCHCSIHPRQKFHQNLVYPDARQVHPHEAVYSWAPAA